MTLPMPLPDRLLSFTPARLLRLLRRPRSAGELAAEVGVSGTAVRAHLARMERDGLVRPAGKRPGTRRPEVLYGLTPEAEQLFPKAYAAAFSALLGLLREREAPAEVEALLREAGRRLAADFTAPPGEPLPARLERAVGVLDALGGHAEVHEVEGGHRIQGHSCPLAALAAEHAPVCLLAAAILEEVLGVPVREVCSRGPAPRCAFAVAA